MRVQVQKQGVVPVLVDVVCGSCRSRATGAIFGNVRHFDAGNNDYLWLHLCASFVDGGLFGICGHMRF